MHPSTAKLHLTLLRLAKGALAAWEDWLATTAHVEVPKPGQEWKEHAEVVAAAQIITTSFKARQERERRAAHGGPPTVK